MTEIISSFGGGDASISLPTARHRMNHRNNITDDEMSSQDPGNDLCFRWMDGNSLCFVVVDVVFVGYALLNFFARLQ